MIDEPTYLSVVEHETVHMCKLWWPLLHGVAGTRVTLPRRLFPGRLPLIQQYYHPVDREVELLTNAPLLKRRLLGVARVFHVQAGTRGRIRALVSWEGVVGTVVGTG